MAQRNMCSVDIRSKKCSSIHDCSHTTFIAWAQTAPCNEPCKCSVDEICGFNEINTDGCFVVVVLIDAKVLDGDHFAHIFGQGWMDKLSVVIVRNVHGNNQKQGCTWDQKKFRGMQR